MPKKITLIQGTTVQHYHVVPGELTLRGVTPERSAIFQYLSHISWDRFVEFVVDILVHVQKHQLVDNTDGPGDEKQDILTIDPEGKRHLTQCKHTSKFDDNANGDDLDTLFAACLRKNCQRALYVTNADLTVQAKRYITDAEYARGWPESLDSFPRIDYWNGNRIWGKIAKDNYILNKWFSGMAQAHGLRTFFVDLVIRSMPSWNECELRVKDFVTELGRSIPVECRADEDSYQLKIDNDLTVDLSEWIRGSEALGLPVVPPTGVAVNIPLRTLRAHITVSTTVDAYDPAIYRDRIAAIFGGVLPTPTPNTWWHILSTEPQAFIFLHDFGKPISPVVEHAQAYVRVGDAPTSAERQWATDPGKDFVDASDNGDDLAWKHKGTSTSLQVYVQQRVHPAVAYDLSLRHENVCDILLDYQISAVVNAGESVLETVRRLSRPDWYVLHSSSGDVYLCYPRSAATVAAEDVGAVLARTGIKIKVLSESEKRRLVGMIRKTPPETAEMTVTDRRELTTPIDLRQRIFWFSSDHDAPEKDGADLVLRLLKYKFSYEARHGYDALHGRDQMQLASEEIRRLLFDVFTLRGDRMLDIGFTEAQVSIHLRCRSESLASAEELIRAQFGEFQEIERDVVDLLRSK
jgi:hypothetical protein